ncbi:MAG: ABC transporter substrate-binding protein [Oscillospiraceae bacterium]|nr:ABC transporter substrate-binding protein [Oscillospiraceae bacterium]
MKHLSKKIICILCCLSLLAVILCGCSRTKENGVITLTVSEVAHSVFYAPQYAAIALGYFEEEGLNIELINGNGADKVMTSVLSGEADIGLAGPEAAIYVYLEGKEDHAVVFSQLTKRDGSFLVSREPIENFSFDLLKGKYIIGGRAGGVPLMTLEYVLKQNGLYPGKDLTVDSSVQFAMMAGAFTGGTGDFVTLFEPTASAVVSEGKGYIVASIGEESGEIPYTAYFANKSFLSENPETVQKFTNAITKGQKWVATHSAAEIAEVIASFFPDTDLPLLTKAMQSHIDIDAWNTDSVMEKQAFDRLQDVMTEAGELDKRVDFEALVDNSFAQKAK